jgi:hypothetical protein
MSNGIDITNMIIHNCSKDDQLASYMLNEQAFESSSFFLLLNVTVLVSCRDLTSLSIFDFIEDLQRCP